MRFGLQARFIAILLLAGMVALGALLALNRQSDAHDSAVAAAVQDLFDHGAAQQVAGEQQQGNLTARIDTANHNFRVDLTLTFFLFGLMLAGVAWLAWNWVVRPVLGLAEIARRIEAGDDIAPLVDSQRDDEVGDLACAFNTLNEALLAAQRRIDHDAAQVVEAPAASEDRETSRPTMALPAVPASAMQPAAAPPIVPTAAPALAAAPVPAAPAPPAPTAEELERQRRLEDDLREAWQRNEISIVYQPIHALANGSMRGAEALLRWNHRIEGPVSPGEFIPLAERSDIIVQLGHHVLVQACSDASLWPGDGTPENSPFISVNVAARQLRDPQLFEYVVEALRKSGLAASRLHLEMPVAILREGESETEAMLEQLRGLGVQIWLDATGADAADQERWMKAPVSGVKVGRSRIADKGEAATGEAAIVATARALRIVAVVVGVEELSELNVLREQGADLAQGYVLCKPVNTAEIGRRLLA